MGLFRHSSKKKESSASPPLTSKTPSRSNSLKSIISSTSVQSATPATSASSPSKYKSFLRQSPRVSPEPSHIDQVTSDEDHDVDRLRLDHLTINPPSTKRISTIVETECDDVDGSGGSEFEDEDVELKMGDDDDDYDSNDLEESGLSDEEEYDHLHVIKSKARAKSLNSGITSQINSFMVYCGLANDKMTDAANEELKRTFSLLDSGKLKIHPVSSTTNRTDSKLREPVINEAQLEIITKLTEKLNTFYELKGDLTRQYLLASLGKTVYQRYGTVTRIIGRGAYGLIKIIDPVGEEKGKDETASGFSPPPSNKKLFAVKEILRRGTDKVPEAQQKFIERVLSEFIISSTLNYKHLVKTCDLMITLPPLVSNGTHANGNNGHTVGLCELLKISQVMECTPGGDLFTYMSNKYDRFDEPVNYLSLEEIDCFIKQIAKGLWYMHQHGVAHCDLKLENILLSYLPSDSNELMVGPRDLDSKISLKLSDFGSANVFRTKWDRTDQITPFTNVPIGSESYIAPEEYGGYTWCSAINLSTCKNGYSPAKKDNWALGIVILVLFNLRKNYYSRKTDSTLEGGSGSYLWHSTEPKNHKLRKEKLFKDKNFEEYVNKRMIADYECKSKEWLIHRKGTFGPIETLFDPPRRNDDDEDDEDENNNDINNDNDKHDNRDKIINKKYLHDDDMDQDEKDLCELRKLFIYKLLDPDPNTRLTVEQFLKSDWMRGVESCI